MVLYAKKSDSCYIEAENFVIEKIFNMKDNNHI